MVIFVDLLPQCERIRNSEIWEIENGREFRKEKRRNFDHHPR